MWLNCEEAGPRVVAGEFAHGRVVGFEHLAGKGGFREGGEVGREDGAVLGGVGAGKGDGDLACAD